MTTSAGGSLNTDLDLMTAVAGKIDARNEEIRAMLQTFIGRMVSVPPSATIDPQWQAEWRGEPLHLPDGGELRLPRGARLDPTIMVRLRCGGERIKPAGDAHKHGRGPSVQAETIDDGDLFLNRLAR